MYIEIWDYNYNINFKANIRIVLYWIFFQHEIAHYPVHMYQVYRLVRTLLWNEQSRVHGNSIQNLKLKSFISKTSVQVTGTKICIGLFTPSAWICNINYAHNLYSFLKQTKATCKQTILVPFSWTYISIQIYSKAKIKQYLFPRHNAENTNETEFKNAKKSLLKIM